VCMETRVWKCAVVACMRGYRVLHVCTHLCVGSLSPPAAAAKEHVERRHGLVAALLVRLHALNAIQAVYLPLLRVAQHLQPVINGRRQGSTQQPARQQLIRKLSVQLKHSSSVTRAISRSEPHCHSSIKPLLMPLTSYARAISSNFRRASSSPWFRSAGARG